MEKSLYERIGGEAAVMAAVDLFYEKVLADPRTRPFFEGLDMQAQIRKQTAFMTWVFGGSPSYKGRDLKVAHANLVKERGLSDVHFDAIAEHLDATLKELGISPSLAAESMAIVASTRAAVLGHN